MNTLRNKKWLPKTMVLVALAIQGCGGSDSANKESVDDFTPVVTQTGIVSVDEKNGVAQPVELFIYFPGDNLTNINWQQTAGNDVTFLASSSKAIAFTPNEAGEYSFEVTFERNGNNEVLSHTVIVSDEPNLISARLGHAVLEGSNVSLNAYIESSEIASSSIQWQQNSGPNITFSESTAGKTAVFFQAPNVSTDSLLTFTVSASDGTQRYEDTVTILIEDAPNISSSDNIAYDTRLATVFPFNANSPYADVLVNCVYSNTIDLRETCRFNELPLIAHDTTSPSVEDIMNRVVVSHRWMGERFKAFLQNNDQHADFKNLLRATTAIVISYDVRPSYYWAVTGAIHLDPTNLWLTPDERDTINQTPDYRASFGDELNFVMPWRYVKNNQYANFFYPLAERITRDADEGVYELAGLMYHELAHANDYFPQSEWASINKNQRILDNVNDRIKANGIVSDQLSTALPLNGAQMYRLAQVRYQGEKATTSEKNYSPSDVSGFFSPEHAPHFYNYSSKREDYAMLFDELMMKVRYNVDRDIAVTNQRNSSDEEYIVTWGQRGRIGEENIKPRVKYVTQRILPEFNEANDVVNNLSSPIAMDPGKTWSENLAISPVIENIQNIARENDSSAKKSLQRMNNDGKAFYEKPIPQN